MRHVSVTILYLLATTLAACESIAINYLDFYPQFSNNEYESELQVMTRLNQWITDSLLAEKDIINIETLDAVLDSKYQNHVSMVWRELVATTGYGGLDDRQVHWYTNRMWVYRVYYKSNTIDTNNYGTANIDGAFNPSGYAHDASSSSKVLPWF